MQISYKSKLFLYFFLVFGLFTIVVLMFHQIRERDYKRRIMEAKLDIYTSVAEKNPKSDLLPQELRVTLINNGGKVLFDNQVDSLMHLENHFSRPEIKEAKVSAYGVDIRHSESLEQPFFYYARQIDGGFIRVAVPYNVETQLLLKADHSFLVGVLLLFVASLFFLWLIARRFGLDVERLKADVVAQQQARAALKTTLTSSIAHELRTPVSAIRGYTETLIDPDIPEVKRNEFIERTHLAALRLSELLRDISLLTKIEESKQLFSNERVSVRNLVDEVVGEFEFAIHANSVKVENLIPENVSIEGNRTLLYSIFRNLIENAIKYAGKWIVVRIVLVEEDADFYHFSVSDTGSGIPEQFLSRIFERFFRLNDGRSREDGGSGLGLAIVQHAVLHHQGRIWAENVASGGLRIRFSLKKQASKENNS